MATGAETALSEPKGSSNMLMQIGVIALCVLGITVFLTMGGSKEVASADRPTFESIVGASLASPTPAIRDNIAYRV